METQKMTTQFAEIFRAMPKSHKQMFYNRSITEDGMITAPAINSWAYYAISPNNDIKEKRVAGILRDMGYDVDPETLFKKYPKPVKTEQQEK